MKDTLGQINPLTYRGYVYDRETGLYYLQSRYYSPELLRFICADNQLSISDIIGMNLFAYCGNNPINRIDPDGTDWKNIFSIGITTALIGIALLAAIPTGGGSLLLASVGVSTAATTAVASTVSITGIAVAGGALISYASTNKTSKSEKRNRNSTQSNEYSGSTTYNRAGVRIDYEYYGNGNGNVHIDVNGKKTVLWRLTDGVSKGYTVSRSIQKIIENELIAKAILRAIKTVENLGGLYS